LLSALFQYRRLIWRHAVADLRHRYAGTGMGIFWNILHPLGLIAIFSLVFSTIMKPQLPGQSGRFAYTIYLCAGFFPWLAFSDCVTRGCNCFVTHANYLKKLPIPEQVFVAQNAVTSTLGLLINFALLLALAALLGFYPGWRWLLLPIPLLLLQTAGFGIGLILGTLNAFFRDVGEWTAIVLQMVMWTVPIVYLASILPARAQSALRWHPLMPPLSAVRDLFLNGRTPGLATWLAMFAWPAAIVIAAGILLHHLRAQIRDVI
jgi:ABC-type polysaccharide/polyol phosphate export permease